MMPTEGRVPKPVVATVEPTAETTVTRTVRTSQSSVAPTTDVESPDIQKFALSLCEEALAFHLEVLRDPGAS
jgi:hypothetical protein